MAKLKASRVKKKIWSTCKGNGDIRVSTGDTSIDFRNNSKVYQCWDCDSEGEFYETVEVPMVPDDPEPEESIH